MGKTARIWDTFCVFATGPKKNMMVMVRCENMHPTCFDIRRDKDGDTEKHQLLMLDAGQKSRACVWLLAKACGGRYV